MSKQLSNTSKQPDYLEPPIFLDRNIDSPDICGILVKAGMRVHRHNDHFSPEEDDDVWIASVANNNWAILTADKSIERHHIDTVVQSRAKLIFLIGKRSGAIQWSASMVVSQGKIFEILRSNDGPLVIRLGKSGEITKVRHLQEIVERQKKVETGRIIREKRHARSQTSKG